MAEEQDITKKSTPWLGIGAVFAAIGASVCCVGPLLLLSLGIGGAWMSTLTSMEVVRPFFIILVHYEVLLSLLVDYQFAGVSVQPFAVRLRNACHLMIIILQFLLR
jgi:hypothetical protein